MADADNKEMTNTLKAELKKNAEMQSKQMAEMISNMKLSAVKMHNIDVATQSTKEFAKADQKTQRAMYLEARDLALTQDKIDARDEQTKKNDETNEKAQKIRDEKAQEHLENLTGLGRTAQKIQERAAKLAKTAKGKVVDFAKDKIDGIKKAGASLLELLGKGLMLGGLYLLFEAIKDWDVLALWESAKSIGSFLGVFGNFFLTLATSISAWMGLEMIKALFTGKEGKLTMKIKDMILSIKIWLSSFTGKGSFLGKLGGMFKSFVGIFAKIPGVGTLLKFIKGAAKFLGKIFLPVTVIMALYDAVMGFMDGFANTEGNLFQKIMGGIGGAIKGLLDFFIFSVLDAVQSVIVWLGEAMGFDMSAISDFDLAGKIREWVGRAVDFITDMFSWNTAGKIGEESDFGNLIGWVSKTWDEVVDWVKGIFAWASDGLASGWTSLTGFVSETWTKVKTWLSGLLAWSETEDAEDSFVIKTIKNTIKLVKDWFGKMFKFDSASDILASVINVLTFFPNMIKDAIFAVTEWLLKLFGFDDTAKSLANANKFSIGEMVMNVLTDIVEWIEKIFDIDIGAIFKESLGALGDAGGKILGWLGMGGEESKEDIQQKIDDLKASNENLAPTSSQREDQVNLIKGLEIKLAKMATGGSILPGGMAIVGEGSAGGELVINTGQSTAKVIPAKQSADILAGNGGGGMVNAPTTVVNNNQSSGSTSMVMAANSIDPMHMKYFRN